ncbi:pirin family protein [Helcobacillus massiliensis]|uniref:Pirin family protein n=1 Tax=Helcobacillus massiliensis TaxID=521392 RepID=A0A839QZT2_9MICO|nr:pirin family protein [Helcobacillus massiliensis]MBB3022907.1 hypothetical protein [Helcobacillus massiliensis]
MDDLTSRLHVLRGREVPLGGPRGMTVMRTLPHRDCSLVGPWCFVDQFGPDDVSATGGMQVARHPHTGLATVSWLFEGAITHRDSIGSHVLVTPGAVDVMTAGRGITHSEFTTNDTTTLHGVQLWFAQPDAQRFGDPAFALASTERIEADAFALRAGFGEHSVTGPGDQVVTARGDLQMGVPLDFLEITLDPDIEVTAHLDAGHEYAVVVDRGPVTVGAGERPVVEADGYDLVLVPERSESVRLTAGEAGARVLLIGGEPLGEDIVMWWNFVGRSHEEIAEFRARYQQEMGFEGADGEALDPDSDAARPATEGDLLFGTFPPNTPRPLPAPRLPGGRLRLRGRRPQERREGRGT